MSYNPPYQGMAGAQQPYKPPGGLGGIGGLGGFHKYGLDHSKENDEFGENIGS